MMRCFFNERTVVCLLLTVLFVGIMKTVIIITNILSLTLW